MTSNTPNNPWKLPTELKTGQKMICEVLDAQPGGYSVRTTLDRLGFLPSAQALTRGKFISAIFIKIQDDLLLFAPQQGNPGEDGDPESSGLPRKPLPGSGSTRVTLPEPAAKPDWDES